jgi:hypothetical protein
MKSSLVDVICQLKVLRNKRIGAQHETVHPSGLDKGLHAALRSRSFVCDQFLKEPCGREEETSLRGSLLTVASYNYP